MEADEEAAGRVSAFDEPNLSATFCLQCSEFEVAGLQEVILTH